MPNVEKLQSLETGLFLCRKFSASEIPRRERGLRTSRPPLDILLLRYSTKESQELSSVIAKVAAVAWDAAAGWVVAVG